MVQTALYDPVVVEPSLTAEKVTELLDRKAESAKLDYKESLDPSAKIHKVKLAKHAMAMANTAGGYIVVGVKNDGTLVGLAAPDAARLDEATIRAQIAGYCNVPIPVFVDNGIVHGGHNLCVITVLPLPDRIAVASTDGAHSGGSSFRRGDVLVRHGSASERWKQEDADFIQQRLARVKREEWLRDFVGDFRTLIQLAGGPAKAEITDSAYDASPEDFKSLLLDLLRP